MNVGTMTDKKDEALKSSKHLMKKKDIHINILLTNKKYRLADPLFNFPVQDELIDTVMEFIEAIPSVKCSSYYYCDGTGGTGYIRLNYDKSVLALTRKEPEVGLRSSCYVLTEGVWVDENENKCFLI